MKKYVFMGKEYSRAIEVTGGAILTDAGPEIPDVEVKDAVQRSLASEFSWAQFAGDLKTIEVEVAEGEDLPIE